MANEISIEVAYALADKQHIVKLSVPQGTTMRQAVLMSKIDRYFPGLDLEGSALGIFSKSIAVPEEHEVQDGDRIEIYRPLLADPKEARKRRAEKAAQARQSD